MKQFLFIGVLSIAFSSQAQYFDKYFGVAWDINKPLANKEFIKNTSARGVKIFYHEFINNRFSIGGELGLNVYNGYIPPATYVDGTGSVNTDLYSYAYNYHAAIAGNYYFNTEKWIIPFAGLGIGATYNKYALYYNIYNDSEAKWGALLRPQAGALLRFGKKTSLGAIVGIHFDYATAKSANYDYKNFTNIGFQIGLMRMNW